MKKRLCRLAVTAAAILGLCLCFALVCEYLTNPVDAVYIRIFHHFTIFGVLLAGGIFFVTAMFIKYNYRARKTLCIYVSILTAFLAGVLFLFQGHADITAKLRPKTNTTGVYLARNSSSDAVKWLFTEYYFADKNLTVAGDAEDFESAYIFREAVAPEHVRTGGSETLTQDVFEKMSCYPVFTDENCLYVIDEYWENTENICLVKYDGKYIFCSEELLSGSAGAQTGIVETGYGAAQTDEEENINLLPFRVLGGIAEATPYKSIKQVMCLMLLFVIGMALTLPFWGGKYLPLAMFMSMPMGAAAWCLLGTLLVLLGIPYNLYTMGGLLILAATALGVRFRNEYKKMDWIRAAYFVLAAFAVTVFLVYSKICHTSSDSYDKMELAYRLAKYGTLRDILAEAAPYGMLEPLVLSLGYMAQCDFLYAFYPLMAFCGIGLMGAGLYYADHKKVNTAAMLTLLFGILLLLTNSDYLLSCFYAMAHGPTAVYTTILIMFIVLKERIDIPFWGYAAVVSGSIILLTRVEGTIYVVLILTAALIFTRISSQMKYVNIITACVAAGWHIAQFILIGNKGGAYFWTPDKGIICLVAIAAMSMVTLLINVEGKFIAFIRKYYFELAIFVLCFGTTFVSLFLKRELASKMISIYLAHFSNSADNETNAVAFWTFLFLLMPVLSAAKEKVNKFAFISVFGYLVLIYTMVLFRGDFLIHLGYGDSARRTIVQIMPSAVWLVAEGIAICMGTKDSMGKSNEEKGIIE